MKSCNIFNTHIYLVIPLSYLSLSAQTAKKLDSLFNAINADSSFSGSVLIAENGIPVYERTMGDARSGARKGDFFEPQKPI